MASPSYGAISPPAGDTIVYDVVLPVTPKARPPLLREAPIRLIFKDFWFVTRHMTLIPRMFLPFKGKRDVRPLGLLYQVAALGGSLVLTAVGVSAGIGLVSPVIALLATMGFIKVAEMVQGAQTRHSKADVPLAPGHEKEEWIFVNGIGTTGTGAQEIINHLHKLFHRPVTAVLNRSMGLWFDLIECILQRDLLMVTPDIRVGYHYVRKAVLDPKIERVVLLAHSQGGIIVSAWADQLLCDFPASSLSKVEIYTFAAAANHFSNPQWETFGAIEHFANENDLVSRFGVIGVSPPPGMEEMSINYSPEDDGRDCAWKKPGDDSDSSDGGEGDAVDKGRTTSAASADSGVGIDSDKGKASDTSGSAVSSAKSGTETTPRARHRRGRGLPRENGYFGGRIFFRPKHSGHLLLSHYLADGDSILDLPSVRKHSNLVRYFDGGNALA